MKIFLLFTYVISIVLPAPAPQDFLEEDAEFIEDDSQLFSNQNRERPPIVIVIKPTDFLPKMPRLPEFPPLPKLDDLPRIPHPLEVFQREGSENPFDFFPSHEDRHPFDVFGDILDERNDSPHPLDFLGDMFEKKNAVPHPFNIFRDVLKEGPVVPNVQLPELFPPQSEDKKPDCGFLCAFLGGVASTLDGGIKSVFASDGKGNHTYDEKILPDGSVLRVNSSTFHNTDDDGNGFFFHTSLHHVVSDDRKFGENTPDVDKDDTAVETPESPKTVEDSQEAENIETNLMDTEEVENETSKNEIFAPIQEVNDEIEPVDVVEEENETSPKDLIDLSSVDEEENEIDVDLKLPTISVSGIDDGLFQ